MLAVYELFVFVVKPRQNYTYDLYTALEHLDRNGDRNPCNGDHYKGTALRRGVTQRFAVGITQGLVHVDQGDLVNKSLREKFFPLVLIDRGVTFQCQDGEASVAADKVKILAEIGNKGTTLNQTIHGVMAAGALERVPNENSERRHLYLEAVRNSPPRRLRVALHGEGDTQENVTALIEALAGGSEPSKCEQACAAYLGNGAQPRALRTVVEPRSQT